ncbi:hypothetical protein RCL1_000387 [Eukaryota sp. TZLM3-RCL]
MTVHNYGGLAKLLVQRRQGIYTDFTITFAGQQFHCHKAVAVLSSSTIASLVASQQNSLEVPENVETTAEAIDLAIDGFYGASSLINGANALQVYLFAHLIGFDSLKEFSKEVIRDFKSKTFSLSYSDVLQSLQNDQFCDFRVVYNDISLKSHRFILASLNPFFHQRFHFDTSDSCDFSKLLKVNQTNFESFFVSFYKGSLRIELPNLFDISHLSSYFKMQDLVGDCDKFLHSSKPSLDWVLPALLASDKSDDLRFISELSKVLQRIPALKDKDSVAVSSEALLKMVSLVDIFWLAKVMTYSYLNYKPDTPTKLWNPQALEQCLKVLPLKKIFVTPLYEFLKPLFSLEPLFSVLAQYSLERLTTEVFEVPTPWLTWLMTEVDKHEKNLKQMLLTEKLVTLLPKHFTSTKLESVSPLILSSNSLMIYAKNLTQQYWILWTIQSLIHSFTNQRTWTTEVFQSIVNEIVLDNVDPRAMASVLKPLEGIWQLYDFYCKYISTKITPLLLRDYDKQSKNLDEARTEIGQLKKKVNEHSESERQHKNDLQKKNRTISQLQTENRRLEGIVNEPRMRNRVIEPSTPVSCHPYNAGLMPVPRLGQHVRR